MSAISWIRALAVLAISLQPSVTMTVRAEGSPAPDLVLQSPAMPAGGMESLGKLIKYPADALRDSLQGRVNVQVSVDAEGRVAEILVLQSVRADLDSAAVQAVRACQWQAARNEQGPQACTVVVPVCFRIASKP
jgi:protein TonB